MKTLDKIILGTVTALVMVPLSGCQNDSPCQGMSYNTANAKGNLSDPSYGNTSRAYGSTYGSSTSANSSGPTCREDCSYDSKVGCCWCPN